MRTRPRGGKAGERLALHLIARKAQQATTLLASLRETL
jgi:hypothetical protein